MIFTLLHDHIATKNRHDSPTLHIKATIRGVQRSGMHIGIIQGPLHGRIEQHNVCIRSNLKRALVRIESKQLCRVCAHKLDKFGERKDLFASIPIGFDPKRIQKSEHLLSAGDSRIDSPAVAARKLLLPCECTVVRCNHLHFPVNDGFLQGLVVSLVPKRRCHDIKRCIRTFKLASIKEKVVGSRLDVDLKPLLSKPAHGIKATFGGDMHDIKRALRFKGDSSKQVYRLAFSLRWAQLCMRCRREITCPVV